MLTMHVWKISFAVAERYSKFPNGLGILSLVGSAFQTRRLANPNRGKTNKDKSIALREGGRREAATYKVDPTARPPQEQLVHQPRIPTPSPTTNTNADTER